MAWSTPATWSVGEVPTETKMNAQIRDNFQALDQHEHTGADGDGAVLGAYFNVFGDGADGSLHVTSGSPVTISANKAYTDVTVDSGAVLTINSGLTVRVRGTFENNGTVRSNGQAGAAGIHNSQGGAGGSSTEGGGAGGAGGFGTQGSPGSPTSVAQPGLGGIGPTGSTLYGYPGHGSLGRAAGTGGGGGLGAGNGAGGGGGEGGGWYRICASAITGTGTFSANGGAGGNGDGVGDGNDGAGGGGGGGGYIERMSVAAAGGSLTWTVAGGAGGLGSGAFAAGAAGQNGVTVAIVLTSTTG